MGAQALRSLNEMHSVYLKFACGTSASKRAYWWYYAIFVRLVNCCIDIDGWLARLIHMFGSSASFFSIYLSFFSLLSAARAHMCVIDVKIHRIRFRWLTRSRQKNAEFHESVDVMFVEVKVGTPLPRRTQNYWAVLMLYTQHSRLRQRWKRNSDHLHENLMNSRGVVHNLTWNFTLERYAGRNMSELMTSRAD